MFDSLRGSEYTSCTLCAGCKRVSIEFITDIAMKIMVGFVQEAHIVYLLCNGSNKIATELLV